LTHFGTVGLFDIGTMSTLAQPVRILACVQEVRPKC
jgi:hypothetical protein